MVIKYLRDEDTSQKPKLTINSLDFSLKKNPKKLETKDKADYKLAPEHN